MTPESPGLPAPLPGPTPRGLRRGLRRIFLSADGRTRSGWTLLAFLGALYVLGFGYWGITVAFADRLTDATELQRQTVQAWAQILMLLAATWIASRLGRQRLADAYFDPFQLGKRLGLGLLAGAGLVSLSAVLPIIVGEHRFAVIAADAGRVTTSLLLQLLMLVPAATAEEFATRGLLLQQLIRAFQGLTGWLLLLVSLDEDRRARIGRRVGIFFGVLITSAFFGVAHAENPNASPYAVANIVLVGLVFAVITLRQGSLWAAVGLHIGWNVCLGLVWGLPVSGFDFGLSLLEPSHVGAEGWTGGSFGPEASALTSLILLLALIASALLPFRRSPEASLRT